MWFLIEIDGKKIYHAGDTGLTMDMKLLEDEHIDLAFLPIGGNFTMDVKDAARACEFIKPDRVVPIHYDTFDLIKADPKKLQKKSRVCRGSYIKSWRCYNTINKRDTTYNCEGVPLLLLCYIN